MRFDDSTARRLRSGLMQRGLTLSSLLADVLAGKRSDSALAAMGVGVKPGLRPAEALRMALDALETRRTLLDARDDRFGRCDTCGCDLGVAALGELPWADRCQAHAAM